jgi:hypothetical protein
MNVHWTETAQDHIKPDQIDVIAVVHGARNVLSAGTEDN